MSKRPTDHLEPSSKRGKRGSDRQLTKDDPSDSDEDNEGVEAGTFQRASEDVLKQRKIVRARRGAGLVATEAEKPDGAAGQPPLGPSSNSNPFAGVSLTAPKPGGKPFATVTLVPSAAPAQQDAKEEAGSGAAAEPASTAPAPAPGAAAAQAPGQPSTGATITTGSGITTVTDAASAGTAGAAAPPATTAEPTKPAAPAPAGTAGSAAGSPSKPAGSTSSPPSIFGSFASTTSRPFAVTAGTASGFAFGSSSAAGTAATSGFGLLGATAGTSGSSLLGSSSSTDAAKPGGFSFDTKAAFSFSTTPASSAFPSVQSVFGSSTSQLFGGSGPSGQSTPAVKLAEEAAVTGEEDETGVFTGDGVLYEFDEAKQWRERGRGELHVNRAASGQARLVMRQKGNLRLLLNANLFPEMTVTTMDGGKGVTFQCINHAKGGEEKPGEGEAKPAEAPALATFAYRIKQPGQVEEFKRVIETHKAGPKKANGEEQV